MSESHRAEAVENERVERLLGAGSPEPWLCVLVVGDSTEEGAILGPLLARAGFAVRVCSEDGPTGVDAFVRELPDLIVTRDPVVGPDGFELIRRIREISDVPVVVVGKADPPESRDAALRLGADRYVTEPHELESLPRLAVDLTAPSRSPVARRPLTAARVRRAAQSALRAELAKLLVDCSGNLAEMARRMGKDRSTIRYHLRRFGMLAEENVTWAGEP